MHYSSFPSRINVEKTSERFTVVLGRTNHLKYPIHPKTYSSDLNSTFDYASYTTWTNLKPRLTVRKLITSPILSLTLLQIYCIGLIGPIFYSIWVWATNCDPTITIRLLLYSDQINITRNKM